MTAPSFLANNAATTAAVLSAVLDLVGDAQQDRWSHEFYTDIVWNVARSDNVDFTAVRNEWNNYATSIGLEDLLGPRGWTTNIDVCYEDDVPLRMRLVSLPSGGRPVNMRLLNDMVGEPLRQALTASLLQRRTAQS